MAYALPLKSGGYLPGQMSAPTAPATPMAGPMPSVPSAAPASTPANHAHAAHTVGGMKAAEHKGKK